MRTSVFSSSKETGGCIARGRLRTRTRRRTCGVIIIMGEGARKITESGWLDRGCFKSLGYRGLYTSIYSLVRLLFNGIKVVRYTVEEKWQVRFRRGRGSATRKIILNYYRISFLRKKNPLVPVKFRIHSCRIIEPPHVYALINSN